MNSLRLCGGSATTTDMLAMNRTFMWPSLRAAATDAARFVALGTGPISSMQRRVRQPEARAKLPEAGVTRAGPWRAHDRHLQCRWGWGNLDRGRRGLSGSRGRKRGRRPLGPRAVHGWARMERAASAHPPRA